MRTLFAALALFLAVSSSMPAQELFPEKPSLPPQAGDTDQVSVSISEMRSALWYKDMYGVARSYIRDQSALTERILKDEKEAVEALGRSQDLVKLLGITTGAGATAALILTLILVLR